MLGCQLSTSQENDHDERDNWTRRSHPHPTRTQGVPNSCSTQHAHAVQNLRLRALTRWESAKSRQRWWWWELPPL